jgi:hypothetical protein
MSEQEKQTELVNTGQPVNPEIVETGNAIRKLEAHVVELRELSLKRFPAKRIVKMVEDLCTANNVRMTKYGEIETPDWEARKNGLDRVMAIGGFDKRESISQDRSPSKIIIQVLNTGTPNVKP